MRLCLIYDYDIVFEFYSYYFYENMYCYKRKLQQTRASLHIAMSTIIQSKKMLIFSSFNQFLHYISFDLQISIEIKRRRNEGNNHMYYFGSLIEFHQFYFGCLIETSFNAE